MRARQRELLTASQVAKFCQVDLKTIHNWADRGQIDHFRTPGRHLRFRRPDVLDFLRRYGYPVPNELVLHKPRVVLIQHDDLQRRRTRDALESTFDVKGFASLADALLFVGATRPDTVVLDSLATGPDGRNVIDSLRSIDATRTIRVVLFSSDPDEKDSALGSGASAFVHSNNFDALTDTLMALLGTRN
ncbi:MAG: helix-turn-helix domain-containing protein [Polyangiales bacterium]